VNSALLRTLLVYGIVLPVAVIVGWMLSTPLHLESISVVGGVIFILLLPTILAHHYAILIFSWNALLNAFFLPGKPYFWTLMVAINIGMMVMYRILQRRPLFIHVPSLTFSVIGIFLVVFVTAKLRGGIGVRALGSDTFGGKQYFYVFMSLLGYFALASRAIDFTKINRYTGLFFLSGVTGVVSHVIYFFPTLYILYEVFPVGHAVSQYLADHAGAISRLTGFGGAASAVVYFLLARFGLKGTLSKPVWAVLFVVMIGLSMLGGFRSTLIFLIALCFFLFFVEGLLKTKWAAIAAVVALLSFTIAIPLAPKLPRAAQRVLSLIPSVEIDPVVRADAFASLDWRLRLWAAVLPEAPKYVWLGKGYALNPTDMFLTLQAVRRGFAPDYGVSMQVGDYHNGPLSVFMTFGLPGSVVFLAFLIAMGRALYLNSRNGSPHLATINRFLFAFFIAKVVFFLSVFGSFHSDLPVLTGIAGLTVALNRGVCRYPSVQPQPRKASAEPPFGYAPSPA
jgi:hypothetical protein